MRGLRAGAGTRVVEESESGCREREAGKGHREREEVRVRESG